jgi:hypothetical protein
VYVNWPAVAVPPLLFTTCLITTSVPLLSRLVSVQLVTWPDSMTMFLI